jgi:hypothetical protein
MKSPTGKRIVVVCWAVAFLGSLGLWVSSYLNYSYYSRQFSYGFMQGNFWWFHRKPGTYGANLIFPNGYSWSFGTYTPDETSCYIIVKRGKARPHWKISGSTDNGDLMRIDGCWTYFGFFGWKTLWWPRLSGSGFTLPLWIPPLLLIAIAIRPFLRFIERKRWHSQSRCMTCGYNLTGNVSGVCPECGEKIQPISYH